MSSTVVTPEVRAAAEKAASDHGVCPILHESDELLRYIISVHGAEKGVAEYFRGGRNSAAQTRHVMDTLGLPAEPSVLEFAAGFGRVSRHLPKFLGTAKLTASDIHIEGCRFITEQFDIPTFPSSYDPADLDGNRRYDFIFVLSLFSHLPDHSFGPWLKRLYGWLNPSGCLLITTNGQVTMRRRAEFWGKHFDPEKGYGYARQSDQTDLDADEYGSMAISLAYIARQIDRHIPDALLHSFRAGTWFGQQDEWILRKPA